MKQIIALFVLAITAPLFARAEEAPQEDISFEDEFLQGMEAGFFLRNNPDGYMDYQCPQLTDDNKDFKKIQEFFGPVKMIINMLKNEEIERTWQVVEVFMTSMMTLDSVQRGYSGSEYCKGLLYGIHGTRMLINVGKHILAS